MSARGLFYARWILTVAALALVVVYLLGWGFTHTPTLEHIEALDSPVPPADLWFTPRQKLIEIGVQEKTQAVAVKAWVPARSHWAVQPTRRVEITRLLPAPSAPLGPTLKPALIHLVGAIPEPPGPAVSTAAAASKKPAPPRRVRSHPSSQPTIVVPTAYAVSADGERLAWTWQGRLHLTAFPQQSEVPQDWTSPLASTAPVTDLALFDDSTVMVLNADSTVEKHDLSDAGNPTAEGVTGLEEYVGLWSHGPLVAFSEFSKRLGPARGTVGYISLDRGRKTRTTQVPIPTDVKTLSSLAVFSSGTVALGFPDGHVTIFWGEPDRTADKYFLESSRPVKALAFLSKDLLLAADDESSLYLLTAGSRNGQRIGTVREQVAILAASGNLVAWVGNKLGGETRTEAGEITWSLGVTEEAKVYGLIFSIVMVFINLIVMPRPR